MELEYIFELGKHSINLMLSTSYVGLGLSVAIGDYTIMPQLHLLLLSVTVMIDRGRKLK